MLLLLQDFLRGLDPRHVRVAEHRQPVGLHFQHDIERFVERLRRLVRQAVNQVEVDRAVTQFAHPIHRLLRHFARLDAVNGLLHLRVEILHAHRGAVETDFAQRDHVLAREPARVHFHAGFDVRRKREMLVDDFAEPADFVGLQKRRRAAAEMELDGFALRIQPRRHLRHFAAQAFHIGHALVVVERDDGGAAAKPAERLAERDVKINRKVAGRPVVRLDFFGQLRPRDRVGEFRGGRIAGVTRPGHVVFLHQIQINFQRAHGLRKWR